MKNEPHYKKQKKFNLSLLALPLLGLSLMGNKGCNDKEQRLLRMDVDIGHIQTLPLKVDQQEEIRIDQLTRNLFARTIYGHNHFSVMGPLAPPIPVQPPVVPAPPPIPEPPIGCGSEVSCKAQNLAPTQTTEIAPAAFSEKDKQLLFNYGFNLQPDMATDVDSEFKNHSDLSTKALSNDLNAANEVPSCQWEKPQLTLNSDVIGFELVNRTGIGVGYSPSGTHLDELRGRVNFINFRLDYGITAIHPLLNRMVAATEAVEHQSSVEVIFDFGQNAPLTIDFFFQEALVKVIKEGMNKSLNRLVKRLQEQTTGAGKDWNRDVWESRVLLDPAICGADDCVAIRGGTLNRIKMGDRFNVTNMIHTWEGEPCQSSLVRSVPDLTTTNEIVIEAVGDAVAVGRVQSSGNTPRVEPGAMVKLTFLNEPKDKKKKK